MSISWQNVAGPNVVALDRLFSFGTPPIWETAFPFFDRRQQKTKAVEENAAAAFGCGVLLIISVPNGLVCGQPIVLLHSARVKAAICDNNTNNNNTSTKRKRECDKRDHFRLAIVAEGLNVTVLSGFKFLSVLSCW